MPSMMARNPSPGEVERAAEVASLAFPNLSMEHWQESFGTVARMFGERFILVVELDGVIVSTLLCCPAPVVVRGGEVTHSSVGAVATIPECRKQGCAGVMMAECVKLLREEGIATSSLWPFSYEYYRKFGWEVGAEVRTYSADGKVFAALGDANRARPANDGDLAAISLLYIALVANRSCGTVRSEEWWHKIARLPEHLGMATEPGARGVVVHEHEGLLDGYTVYTVYEKDGGKYMDVQELMHSTPEARLDMLALIGSLHPEAPFSFNAPADDLLLHQIPNPRAIHTVVDASFQFRVIDPELAMQSFTPMDIASGEITFALSDPVFRHGFEFGVEFDDGEISLSKPRRANRLEMDVQTLARLYTGYLSAWDAWEIGKVKTEHVSAIVEAGELFTPTTPYRSWLDPG